MKGKRGGLKRLAAEIGKEVAPAVFVGAEMVANEAQYLITAGSVSGKGHVPSKPGEAPNNDLGTLKNNIEAIHVEPLRAIASSSAPYARILEYGSSRISERPYMRPAAAIVRKDVVGTIRAAINRAVRKAGS